MRNAHSARRFAALWRGVSELCLSTKALRRVDVSKTRQTRCSRRRGVCATRYEHNTLTKGIRGRRDTQR